MLQYVYNVITIVTFLLKHDPPAVFPPPSGSIGTSWLLPGPEQWETATDESDGVWDQDLQWPQGHEDLDQKHDADHAEANNTRRPMQWLEP